MNILGVVARTTHLREVCGSCRFVSVAYSATAFSICERNREHDNHREIKSIGRCEFCVPRFFDRQFGKNASSGLSSIIFG
ncbi:unnamed protein product [Callosobruchus maculatus]|uniref:Uncharacterized protein n=1 Tax=Callosobruchus maculatus TaxID=64391 RepID=A0A653BYV9_CALMS|nr:unnamed protein product [Callosobruchus maculatus]